MEKQKLTIDELAQHLRVSRSTIIRRMREGMQDIGEQKVIKGRNTWFFDEDEVIDYLKKTNHSYGDK